MNNRKNQNSIIVLATLGVYLGLVLAGATPQVLAQAAMTRQFDVKDEIEVKDDLDKKPFPTTEESDKAVGTYFDDLADFVGNLRKLHTIEKFDPSFDTFNVESLSFAPCPETGTVRGEDKDSYVDRWLVPAIIEAKFTAEHLAHMGDCSPFDGFPGRTKARSAKLELSYDRSELKFGIVINASSSARAQLLHSRLSQAFGSFDVERAESYAALRTVLYKRTDLTTSNNQVFIVTRLPRAGLDSLLAIDAK